MVTYEHHQNQFYPSLLPSLPPSETCFSCRGCCIFENADSVWRPYFTQDEIRQAVSTGVSKEAFRIETGSKITLIPHGDRARCPALDPITHACTIYPDRPLDCQLYPFILMWSDGGYAAVNEVSGGPGLTIILALHEACPFVYDSSGNLPPDLRARADHLINWLESSETVASLSTHSGLVMPTQPDTIPIATLRHLTAALTIQNSKPKTPNLFLSLTPFQPEHYSLFDQYRSMRPPSEWGLAHQSFCAHVIWSDLLEYRWAIIEGSFCLFATAHGVTHLALPPMGVAPTQPAVAAAFEMMRQFNPDHIPSRIDNVDEKTAHRLGQLGYRIHQETVDYLYRREDIVNLTGNRFRAQRAATNQAARHQPTLRPFHPNDREACLTLFDQWMSNAEGETEKMMKEDARFAHLMAMNRYKELGLMGRVVCINQEIRGYTFGYGLTQDQFCILIEVADGSVRGLAAWLFREFCREQEEAVWINTMDSASLPRLDRAKQLWHPARLVPSYTVVI
jgi:Fe-S-cluster containining protein